MATRSRGGSSETVRLGLSNLSLSRIAVLRRMRSAAGGRPNMEFRYCDRMAPLKRKSVNTGAGIAIGAGVGAALSAATDSPVWIGVGIAVGAAVGTASGRAGVDGPDSDPGGDRPSEMEGDVTVDLMSAQNLVLAEAQAEVREIYRAGSVGQAYSGLVWLISAGIWAFGSEPWAIAVMLIGGFVIYPVTTGVCRLLGSPGAIPSANPLRLAGITIPLVGALMIPLVGAATLYDTRWFFPAFMIAMGAHYLPFAFLSGMRPFLYIGALMWIGGSLVGLLAPDLAVLGAWATGLVLILFSIWAAREFRSTNRLL